MSGLSELSELGKILRLVITVAHHPLVHDADDLAASLGVSRATFYRYVKEAQHLGVDLVRVRARAGTGYEVRNWPQCRRLVEIWYKLEVERNVIDRQGTFC